jgi:outer membrane lipoprotein-sorting protein
MHLFLSRSLRFGVSLALIGSSFPTSGAGAMAGETKTTPALTAFAGAWSGITNYTATIVTHETTNDGKSSQDRTYSYKFLKPTNAVIEIVDGPGKGGGAAWHGGDRVKGHQGGMLSGIKLMVPITDGRATSLRGDTLDVASFGYELNHFQSIPGALSEAAGPQVGSDSTIQVTLAPSSAEANGVTKETLDISNASHLPVRRTSYVGGTIVKVETFSNVKINPGLTIGDIDL